jgi:hypothetical protein
MYIMRKQTVFVGEISIAGDKNGFIRVSGLLSINQLLGLTHNLV